MKSLALRLTKTRDVAAIENLKLATNCGTASKALLRAAHLYPDAVARATEAERQLEMVRRDLDDLRAAVRHWTFTRNEADAAAVRLEAIADR